MTTSFQLGIWMIAIGLVPTIFGLLLLRNRLRFLQSTVKTTGIVEEMNLVHLTDGNAYQPKITFTVQNGEKHVLSSVMLSNPPQYRVGQEVPIRYDPNNSGRARIHSFITLWLATTIFASLGAFLFLVGLILMIFNKN